MGLIDAHVSELKAGLHYLYSEDPEKVVDKGFDPSRYDLVIPFTRSESILVQNFLKMGSRRVHPVEPIPPLDSNFHVIDFLLSQIPEGVKTYKSIPRITFTEKDLATGKEYITKGFSWIVNEKNIVAIHPGSGSPLKNWPIDSFANLIFQLIKGNKWKPFLIEGPADGEIIFRIRDLMGKETPEAIKCPDLLLLSSFLLSSQLYLGNDSGVTHLAAALGCPTIALFGPSHPEIWAPRGDSVRVLWKELPCSPCHLKKNIVCDKNICMESIGVKEVLDMMDSDNR